MNPNDNNPQWQYRSDANQTPGQQGDSPAAPPPQTPASPASPNITWMASEYVHHERGAGWYLLLLASTVGLAAAVYFLTKDYFAVGTITVLGVIVAIFAGRKPNQLTYELTSSGIRVAEKTYSYSQFKSFAVMREGALSSINFMPIKRFMPPISAYFADVDEDKITKVIGNHLPYEDRKPDTVDRLSHRLRF